MGDYKDDRDELGEIAESLKTYVEFAKTMGLSEVYMSGKDELKDELKDKESQIETGKQPATASKLSSDIDIPSQIVIFDATQKRLTLDEIRADLGDCTRCKLCEGRTNLVFGQGNPKAKIVFVGEGPGADEDAQGMPFVGRAGKLLTKIINAMGFEREEVYICNVVKCRPPGNRNPEPDEVDECMPFLLSQLHSISPEIIICLGSVAAHAILKLKKGTSLRSIRQKPFYFGDSKIFVTYHPAALLRNPGFRKPLWEDMKFVLAEIGLTPPNE